MNKRHRYCRHLYDKGLAVRDLPENERQPGFYQPCPPIKDKRKTMKTEKLITVLLLILPATLWAQTLPPVIPEPGILPLLAAGGVVAVAVKFIRRKK